MSKIEDQLFIFNQLHKEEDEVYRSIANKAGVSDAGFWILYSLCEWKGLCTQNDLCSTWFFPKQTINSAISKLVKEGYITLLPIPGTRNKKSVELTIKGQTFCEATVLPLFEAERKVYKRFTLEEQEMMLSLYKRHVEYLKEETEGLRK